MAENEFLDLVSDLRGQLEEQIRLDEINKKILSTLDLDEVLREIATSTCQLLNAERATVYVVEPAQGGKGLELVSRKIIGDDIAEIRLPVTHSSLSGYVAATGQSIVIRDVYNTAELQKVSPTLKFDSSWDQQTGFRSKSMIVIAATVNDKVVGVIQALNKKDGGHFNAHDQELLSKLANYVGISLQNSQSHTRVLRRARARSTVQELLVEKGLLSEVKLKEAQERANKEKKKLLELLVERILKTLKDSGITQLLVEQYEIGEVDITKCVAEINGLEYQPFAPELMVNPELFESLPEAYCKRNFICPIKQVLDPAGKLTLTVVVNNPKNFITLEDVEIRTGCKIGKIFMSTRGEIHKMIARALHPDAKDGAEEETEAIGDLFDALAEDLGVTPQEEEIEAANIKEGSKEDDAPIVKLCNRIIEDAFRLGASDIHIEPEETRVLVRVRRDGALEKVLNIPIHAKNALVARYKIMGDMNITEHRVPQDGRIRFKEHGGRYDIELRVNICPTVGGNEDIVMRILADSKPLPLEKMGFMPWVIEPYQKEFNKPYGMILCVGPTGSGKTTTLHATVANINTPDTKILTAENPVEITQVGLRQVQIRPEVGLTFKEALRAFLRQDPDVIMVGEMRDFETCSIAVEAALTGHLLFSTLHTNNAPETVTRLVDIGIDPVTLSDALLCVLAQRLTKTICKKCKKAGQLATEDLEAIGAKVDNGQYLYLGKHFPVEGGFVKGEGCEACNGTGYKGRVGLHELLVCSDEVKRMITSGARIHEIREAAKTDHGDGKRMFELFEDGYFKVMQGSTDVRNIRAVCTE